MKLFRILLILVVLSISVFLLAYHVFLPQMAARSITTGNVPSYVPEKFKPVFEEVQKSVDSGLADLPEFMAANKLSYEELMEIIQSTRYETIAPLLGELEQNPDLTADEAFDALKEMMQPNMDNPEVLRKTFKEYYSPGKLKQGLKYLEESDLPVEMNIELARKTLIEVLKQRRQEIEFQLDLIQENSR